MHWWIIVPIISQCAISSVPMSLSVARMRSSGMEKRCVR